MEFHCSRQSSEEKVTKQTIKRKSCEVQVRVSEIRVTALHSMIFQKVIEGSVKIINPLFSFTTYSSEGIKHQEQLLTRSKKPLNN